MYKNHNANSAGFLEAEMESRGDMGWPWPPKPPSIAYITSILCIKFHIKLYLVLP